MLAPSRVSPGHEQDRSSLAARRISLAAPGVIAGGVKRYGGASLPSGNSRRSKTRT